MFRSRRLRDVHRCVNQQFCLRSRSDGAKPRLRVRKLKSHSKETHECSKSQDDAISAPRILDFLAYTNTDAASFLQEHGLLATLEQLNSIAVGPTATELLTMAKQCYPYPGHHDLTLPQYKKRSIETCLQHLNLLQTLPNPPQTILLGDSMFERLTSRHNILKPSSERLFNFSVGGDGVEHVLCRLDLARAAATTECIHGWHNPTIVLSIGVNNVMGTLRGGNESQSAVSSTDAIVAGIEQVIRVVRASLQHGSDNLLYLCQLVHVFGSDRLDARSINRRIDQLNDRLQQLVEAERTSWPTSNLRWVPISMERHQRNYARDGLHLSPLGYQSFLQQLPQVVHDHATRQKRTRTMHDRL